jgi:hypothetical protein
LPLLKIGLVLLIFARLLVIVARWRGQGGEPASFGNETFGVFVSRGKHKRVDFVHLSVEMPDRFQFEMRKEMVLDRIAKRLGIVREWQTGDSMFDSGVYIASEDWALLERMTADQELRNLMLSVMRIFPRGSLECRRGRLTVLFAPSDVDREATDEAIGQEFAARLVPDLLKLRARLEQIVVGDWEPQRDLTLKRRATLSGICAVIGVAGLAGALLWYFEERFQVVRATVPAWSWNATVTVGVVMLLATWVWMRRSPHTLAVLLDVLLVAAPGAWFAANGGLTWHNQQDALTQSVRWPAKVESVWTSTHKRTVTYHLTFDQWPDERGKREINLREKEYQAIDGARCVTAEWHPGKLGDGWVSGFERAKPGECDRVNVE